LITPRENPAGECSHEPGPCSAGDSIAITDVAKGIRVNKVYIVDTRAKTSIL
jgi:hypothetical protein